MELRVPVWLQKLGDRRQIRQTGIFAFATHVVKIRVANHFDGVDPLMTQVSGWVVSLLSDLIDIPRDGIIFKCRRT